MSVGTTELSGELIPAAAGVHLEAFAGYMNSQLGRGYVEAFLAWFAGARDGIALVAREDGQVLGYVVGAPVGYDRTLNRDLFWTVARAFAVRPWLLLQRRFLRAVTTRLRRMTGSAPRPAAPALPQPVISLVGIGVAKAAQGKGVGRILMDEFERRARLLGMRAMRLSVYDTNAPARALYERSGWSIHEHDAANGVLYYARVLA